jgi:prevent-host-death family protein
MKRVGAYEAKTNLSRLLKQVSKGDRIVITKHGTAIAVLQMPESTEKSDPSAVIREIRAFREQHSLGGLTIRELIEEGRR